MTTSYFENKWAVVEFLRDRLQDPRSARRPTSTSDTFTADGSTVEFTMTPSLVSGSSTVYNTTQHIDSVTVAGSTKKKWEDYSVDLQNQLIRFKTAPASGSIVATYSEGTSNWIYPDLAKVSLTASSYPRINVLVVSSTGDRLGNYQSDIGQDERFQIDIWTKEGQTFSSLDGMTLSGSSLGMYLARKINLAFKDYIDDLYPKLYNYRLINIRDAVWEKNREVFHTIIEIELSSVNSGEE